MKQHNAAYQVVPYPKDRRAAAVLYRSVQHKPMIHGLIEVDVTRARAFLRDHQANTGESLSFTAFIATCLGKAVDEHKSVQACRKGSKHLIHAQKQRQELSQNAITILTKHRSIPDQNYGKALSFQSRGLRKWIRSETTEAKRFKHTFCNV